MTQPLLNKEQQEAVTHGDGPLLIIAGAGTGKTTVISERIKHLVLDKKISTENILALTFTEKAAKEMEERVDIALPYGYTQMWIATFHAFCDRILRDEAIHIGLNPSYRLATETESIIFLRKNLFKLQLDYFRPLGNPNKFLQGLLQHFAKLKDEDITPEQYLDYANKKITLSKKTEEEKEESIKTLELAKAYQTFEDIKVKEGIMDFGDLISYTLKLFRTRKHILKNYQEKFKYILLDEFQDTNYSQNQLAILLTGSTQNITVVGDDDQAIYRWRGAAISNMIQFRQHFPSVKIVTLTKNYRSTKSILDTSYQLIQYNNPDRLEVKEKINKKLTAMRGVAGQEVKMILANRGDDEADEVVKVINQLLQERKLQYKDFAILVRANDHAQPFMRALDRSKIPYQFLGPGQLFHQEEIKDLIAYLKLLHNIEESSSLYRIITLPIFGISSIDIATVLAFAQKRNLTLFESLNFLNEIKISKESNDKLLKIYQMIERHLGLIPKETAGQILYFFLEETGLLQTYASLQTKSDETRIQNVAKFFDRMKAFESQNKDASVFAVVDWLELSSQVGESPLATNSDWSQNDAVNILTIHASKGLEFPVVFVVNMVTQRFPSRERKEQIPLPGDIIKEVLPEGDFHTQEERRLFYVALTRAKDILYLTSAHFYSEGKRERKISPFVIEALGKEALELVTTGNKEKNLQLTLPNVTTQQSENKEIITQYPITYLSYSQIQTFDICPLHYKLRYILHIPVEETSSQVFGTTIHSVLKDFYLKAVQGNKPTIDTIEGILKENWSPVGYEEKAHEKEAYKKALSLISHYIENNYKPSHLPIALEVPFQFSANGSLKIGGRIDRIDRLADNKLEIIDYKTGTNIPDEKELNSNLQLTIYGLAATEIRDPIFNRQPDEVVLSLHYLEGDIKLSTTRTREQLESAKAKLIEKSEEIAKSNFQCSVSIFCQNCEYKMLCKTLS